MPLAAGDAAMASQHAPQSAPSSYSNLSLRSRHSAHPAVDPESKVPAPAPQTIKRRESRMGLRHIFSRSRLTKERDAETERNNAPRHVAELQMPTMDAFYTTTLHKPTSNSSSDAASQQTSRGRSPSRGTQPYNQNTGATNAVRRSSIAPSTQSDHIAAWEMPQLFKANPQALRQATLPAVTLASETVLRLHEKKTTVSTDGADQVIQKPKYKAKKKHRRNTSLSQLEWTTKIYLLTTSGYLLQYTGDGSYDRQPEYALRLNQNSAAFVTDCIPGQHWVLQVCSSAKSDPVRSQEPKSLLAKFPFRMREKQETSNILMNFESPGEMNGWMAVLRAQIEKLGGRRKLSETGQPQASPADAVRERSTSRPIIVRDPKRFSRGHPQSPMRGDSRQDSDDTLKAGEFEQLHDQGADDTSTTTSLVSQDGKRLDSLRDSGNRYSYVSSGHPTVITSTTSSPSNSPTTDSFTRNSVETSSSCDNLESLKPLEPRPRPNASVIASRRNSSLQTGGLFINLNTDSSATVRDSDMTPTPTGNELPEREFANATPNFSVPKSSSRRYSHVRVSSRESSSPPTPPKDNAVSFRSNRGKPPPSLRHSRPLSMVADQSSPRTELPARPPTADQANRPLSPATERYRRGARCSMRSPGGSTAEYPSHRSSIVGSDAVYKSHAATSPRRTIQGVIHEDSASNSEMAPTTNQPSANERTAIPVFTWGEERRLRRVSMEPTRTLTMSPQKTHRRVSLNSSSFSQKGHRRHSSSDGKRPTLAMPSLPPPPPPPSGPLPAIPSSASNPHLKMDKETRALLNRRSMPQMAPPAPPPMRSLPPIPQNAATRTRVY